MEMGLSQTPRRWQQPPTPHDGRRKLSWHVRQGLHDTQWVNCQASFDRFREIFRLKFLPAHYNPNLTIMVLANASELWTTVVVECIIQGE